MGSVNLGGMMNPYCGQPNKKGKVGEHSNSSSQCVDYSHCAIWPAPLCSCYQAFPTWTGCNPE